MDNPEKLPEIKEILCAMLFATREPLSLRQMVNVFKRTAETYEDVAASFIEMTVKDVEAAMEELRHDLSERRLGLEVVEIAGGFRLRNVPSAGPWLRELLDKGKSAKLSKPALETLSIIAYRQPLQRSQIESIRGVAADSIVRNLLEMGLVKVVGRSELPGKPWLYGTTQAFLEHFGLNSLDELPGMAEMRRNLEQRELELKAREGKLAKEGEEAEAETPPLAEEVSESAEESAENIEDEQDEDASRED
ncbi:SMC-Scp complex subunit ScpB [Kiritimatiellaeota bacterium B1221]|nr:SMC-Scp complex subunit ScpB [Kiritimatiellaeota bacterium B1221]